MIDAIFIQLKTHWSVITIPPKFTEKQVAYTQRSEGPPVLAAGASVLEGLLGLLSRHTSNPDKPETTWATSTEASRANRGTVHTHSKLYRVLALLFFFFFLFIKRHGQQLRRKLRRQIITQAQIS